MANPTTGAPLFLQLPPPGGDFGLWGLAINTDLTILNAQTFSLGNPVPTAGLNINAPLSFNGFGLTAVGDVAFSGNTPLAAGDLLLQADNPLIAGSAGDLWYTDGAGHQIQITSGGAVNVAGVGGISGMTGTTASVTYSPTFTNFTFFSAAYTPAALVAGPISIGTITASPNYITLQSPSGTAGYTLTLFPALPVSGTSLVTVTSGGQLGDGATPSITGGLTLSGVLTAGSLSVGAISATGNLTVGGTLGVTGPATLGAGLTVTTGNTSFPSSGNVAIAGALNVSGAAVFSGVVNNGETFTLQGPVTNTEGFTGDFFLPT